MMNQTHAHLVINCSKLLLIQFGSCVKYANKQSTKKTIHCLNITMHGVKRITLTFLARRSGSWQKCQSALELRDNSHIKDSICMCNSNPLVRHKDFLCIYIRVRLRPHISVRIQLSPREQYPSPACIQQSFWFLCPNPNWDGCDFKRKHWVCVAHLWSL